MAFVEYTKIPILKTSLKDINVEEFKTINSAVSKNTMNKNSENILENGVEYDFNGMKSVHIINDEIIHIDNIELQNVYPQKKKYKKIEIKM